MSDSNNPADALAMHDPNMRLVRENASLREQLAAIQANVVQGGFAGEAPRYQLNEANYLDDTYFPAGSQIDYLDEPNLTMVPLNDPAKRRIDEHITRLEEGARRKAVAAGRQFFGLVTDRNNLIDTARLDAQAEASAPVPVIAVPQPYGSVPAMPHTDDARAAARRGPGRPKKVVSSAAPAPQRPNQDAGAPILAPAPSGAQIGPAVVGRLAG